MMLMRTGSRPQVTRQNKGIIALHCPAIRSKTQPQCFLLLQPRAKSSPENEILGLQDTHLNTALPLHLPKLGMYLLEDVPRKAVPSFSSQKLHFQQAVCLLSPVLFKIPAKTGLLMLKPAFQGQIYQEEANDKLWLSQPPQHMCMTVLLSQRRKGSRETGAKWLGQHSNSLNTELTSPRIAKQSSNKARKKKSPKRRRRRKKTVVP